jgi:hypothetical protein
MTEEIIENENELDEEPEVDVKILRLVTGVDIIGFCLDVPDSNLIQINSPMEVVLSREEDAEQNIFLRPWLPVEIMDYNICTVSYSDVLTVIYPKMEFMNYFFRLSKKMQEMIDEDNEENSDDNSEATEEAISTEVPVDKKKLH